MHGGCYTAGSWDLWCCSDRGTPGHGLLWPGAHPLSSWVVLFSLLVCSVSHSWQAVKEHPVLGPQASETWVGPGLEKDPAATALPIAKCSPASTGAALVLSVSPLPHEPSLGNRREGLPSDTYRVQTQLPSRCRNIWVLSQIVAPGSPCALRLPSLPTGLGLWQVGVGGGGRAEEGEKGGKEGAPEFISEGPMISLLLGFPSPPQKSSLCLSPDALTLRLS